MSAIAVALSVTAAVGCSGDAQTEDALGNATVITLAATAESATTSETASPSSPSSPSVPASTPATVAIDAPAMLQASLDSLAAGYHFRTSVTVGGAEVLVAEGDTVGDGTRLTIWANGTSVAYLTTPAGSWVFPEGGEWQVLDTPPATTDPLLALRTPTAVTGTSSDGVAATLVATVAANTLGVPSDGTADVEVVVDGASLSEIGYTAEVEGQIATVRSVFGAVVDASPVVAPI